MYQETGNTRNGLQKKIKLNCSSVVFKHWLNWELECNNTFSQQYDAYCDTWFMVWYKKNMNSSKALHTRCVTNKWRENATTRICDRNTEIWICERVLTAHSKEGKMDSHVTNITAFLQRDIHILCENTHALSTFRKIFYSCKLFLWKDSIWCVKIFRAIRHKIQQLEIGAVTFLSKIEEKKKFVSVQW